ncbi:MAG: hypothetical protein R3A80_05590 [Bdellovibrionota bacterium]
MHRQNSDLKIRKARPQDAEIIYKTELFYAQKSGYLVSRPEDLRLENYQNLINDLLTEENGIYLVATLNDLYLGHRFPRMDVYVKALKLLPQGL